MTGTYRAGLPAHEQVYRRLKDMVLFGDLEPGQPVTIQGLVETLDVGMTPVREALRRLTSEGALDALGNRRIAVPVLALDAVAELTEARLLLEPLLAWHAATAITPEGLTRLIKADTVLDDAITRGDIPGYLRANHAFHAELNAHAARPVLAGMVEGIWLRFGPSLRAVCGQFGTRNLPDRHKDLITALQAGDADAAKQAIHGDVMQGMDLIAQGLG